jgi:hypothetical protein
MEGYESIHAVRKGQIRWIAKGDVVAQWQFIHTIFGMAAYLPHSNAPFAVAVCNRSGKTSASRRLHGASDAAFP